MIPKSKLTPEALGKKLRVYPDNPKYEGVRIRYTGRLDKRTNSIIPGTVDGTFLITYNAGGRLKWETIGKLSQGWTA
ncbi:MAG: hypothetical protein GWN00_34170, partial [Aliifodinibius sp.]|nr:hypothetical protein [Phycisphaerae bacterium]NIT61071.1 hypothetical protein [Fodinibius sp.]NIY29651.1 hypothetical protein [Fodinibius sp.]